MPIVTRINGDPESIRAAARWVKSLAHASVVHGSHRVQDASAESVDAWQDAAADAFRERVDKGIAKVYELVEDASRLGEALTTYADSLAIARDHMEQARWLAMNAGLVVTEREIFEPGPATVETPGGTIDHTLGGNYEEMVDGFEQARIEAGIAESVLYSAWAYVRAIGRELVDGKRRT